MTTANLMETSRLIRLIGSIGKRSSQVHTFIQQAAVGCVGHSIMYGDVRPADALVKAVHNSQRKDSLVKYLEMFGCVEYKAKEKLVVYRKRDLTWDTDYAVKVAKFDWAMAKKAPAPSSIYDIGEKLRQLVEGAHRAIEKGKDLKHASVLYALEDALAALQSEDAKAEQRVRDALRVNATEAKLETGETVDQESLQKLAAANA